LSKSAPVDCGVHDGFHDSVSSTTHVDAHLCRQLGARRCVEFQIVSRSLWPAQSVSRRPVAQIPRGLLTECQGNRHWDIPVLRDSVIVVCLISTSMRVLILTSMRIDAELARDPEPPGKNPKGIRGLAIPHLARQ
jgi:hypothetical protein